MPTTSDRTPREEQGFSLVEVLVVLVIVGILAAIGIPRLLEQRQAGWNSSAVSDLRNLVTVQTSLEAGTGFTDDRDEIADEGWSVSEPAVTVCAELVDGGTDVVLTSWHAAGSVVYSWRRSVAGIVASEIPPPSDCGTANEVS